MKRFVVNHKQYAAGLGNAFFEPGGGVSLTVPGMTLSLFDLVARYTRGGYVSTFTPQYTGEDTLVPDTLERMTEQERIDAARVLKDSIEIERDRLSTRIKERSKLAIPTVPGVPLDTPADA